MTDDMQQYLDEATRDEVTVRVCLDRKLLAEYRRAADDLETFQLEQQGSQAKLDADDGLEEMAQRVVDLDRRVAEAERPFTFECIDNEAWKRLGDEHPATDEQRKQNKYADINDETFWPAAMAATCTTPGMTVKQAEELRRILPRDKWWEIVEAVKRANVDGSEIPKSERGIVARLRLGLRSTTPPNEESPSPSSGDGS